MIGLLQRVSHAEVRVETKIVGPSRPGLLVLVGVERGDSEQQADRLLERLLTYRVFADDEGRMNRQPAGRGRRAAAGVAIHLWPPTRAKARDLASARRRSLRKAKDCSTISSGGHASSIGVVETGEFGAHMQVTLTNDGPVTFWLQVGSVG